MTKITHTRLVFELLKYVRTYKRPLSYAEGYKTILPFIYDWFDYKVTGKENIPKGNHIVCANHSSFLDMLVLSAAFRPRGLNFLAKPSFFDYENICRNAIQKNYLGPLLEETAARAGKIITEQIIEWGTEKVDPDNVTTADMKKYVKMAKTGILALFPEGHRTRTGEMLPLKDGAALLMRFSKNPIVPVGIQGTYHFLKDFWYKKREIRINIGEPMCPKKYKKTGEATQELENRIKNLINL